MSVNDYPMLLATVNNSIGNIKNHLTLEELCKVFHKKENFSMKEQYLIKTIKTEAKEWEVDSFSKNFNISKPTINNVLSTPTY